MILPMMGFVFGLILLGSFASVIAMIDKRSPPVTPKPLLQFLLPYVGYVCLFAGLGALILSMGLAFIGEKFFGPRAGVSGLGFFGGYVLGGCGGAAFGFSKASKFGRHE
jgi:hypothetical protein